MPSQASAAETLEQNAWERILERADPDAAPPELSCITSAFDCDDFALNLVAEIRRCDDAARVEWVVALFVDTLESRTVELIYQCIQTRKCAQLFRVRGTEMRLYPAWNRLMRACRAPLVSTFNPDDRRPANWAPECIRALTGTNNDDGTCLVAPMYTPRKDSKTMRIIARAMIPSVSELRAPDANQRAEEAANLYAALFATDYQKQQQPQAPDRRPRWFTHRLSVTSSGRCVRVLASENTFRARDMFDLDDAGQLVPYDIPNACPVFCRDRAPVFDERPGIPADFAAWLKIAHTSGAVMKQLTHVTCEFCVRPDQLHRNHSFPPEEWREMLQLYCPELLMATTAHNSAESENLHIIRRV